MEREGGRVCYVERMLPCLQRVLEETFVSPISMTHATLIMLPQPTQASSKQTLNFFATGYFFANKKGVF